MDKNAINQWIPLLREKAKVWVSLFMVLVLAIGWMTIDGYNAGADQGPEEDILFMNLKAYAGLVLDENESSYMQSLGENDVLTDKERDHGAAAMYLLAPFTAMSSLRNDSRNFVHVYRMVVFLVFWIGLLALYALVKKMTQSRLAGILAVLMLWLSPRFFAESVYNNKDGLSLATMLMALYCGYLFLEKQNWKTILLFGFTNALAINTRISGFFSFGLVGLLYIFTLTAEKKWSRKALLFGVAAVLSTALCFVLLTPACWKGHFVEFWQYYFVNSSSFTRWKDWTMEAGQVFHTTLRPIPAWYLPVWIAVTTPPIFLLLILGGIISVLVLTIRMLRQKVWPERSVCFRILLGILLLMAYLSVVIGKSNLYNGWRHCYFMYGPMVILAVCAVCDFMHICASKRLRKGGVLLLTLQMLLCVVIIAKTYPYEFAYFNLLAGAHPEENWEVDYWGIGAKDALEKVYDSIGPCSVSDATEYTTLHAWEQSSDELRAAIEITPNEKSDYLLIDVGRMNKLLKAAASQWWKGGTGIYVLHVLKEQCEPVMTFYSGRTLVYALYENPWV